MYNELQKAIGNNISGISGVSGISYSQGDSTVKYPFIVFHLNEKETDRGFSGSLHKMNCQINYFDPVNRNSKTTSSVLDKLITKFDNWYASGNSGSGVVAFGTTRFKREVSFLNYDNLNKNWMASVSYSFWYHE